MWRTVQVAVGVLVMLFSQPVWRLAAADPPQGAKSLFYSDTGTTVAPRADLSRVTPKPPIPRQTNPPSQAPTTRPQPESAATPWFGIAYWIEWARAHAAPTRIADPARFVFQSGDRIRFHVQANRAGYLYVLNRGSSGGTTVLFPPASMADHYARVQARAEHTVPPTGWIVFDDQPGEEGVIFILSPNPLTPLLDRAPLQHNLSPAAETRLMAAVNSRGTKDLRVETDHTQGQEATYAGATLSSASGRPEEGALVRVEIRLQHQ